MDILEAFKELNKIDEGDSSIQEEGLKHQISKAVMDVYDKALDQIVTSYEFKRGCEYFMEVLSDGYSALVDYDCP